MSTKRTLTGKTRYRIGFRKKLILQVEVAEVGTSLRHPDDLMSWDEVEINRTFWKDAEMEDLDCGIRTTIRSAEEIGYREEVV